MSRRISWYGIAVLIAGTLAFPLLAQGPQSHAGRGPHGMMTHAGAGQHANLGHLDLTGKTAFEGVVDSISMEPGKGTPGFTMVADGKRVTIVTAPYRALLDANYKITLGDKMNVLAYPFSGQQGTFAAAELKNLTTGASLILRDESGVPSMKNGACGNCPYNHPVQTQP